MILDELIGINPQLNQIKTKNNTYIYDFLVIATGSEPSYFGHDQWKNFSYGLKNIKDATSMRTKILKAFEKAERIKNKNDLDKLMKFVLIGGGPTGVEMAGAIAELSKKILTKEFTTIDTKTAKIILLEAGPNILPTASHSLSIYAQKTLEKLGVEVKCNTSVKNISEVWLKPTQKLLMQKRLYGVQVLKLRQLRVGLMLKQMKRIEY